MLPEAKEFWVDSYMNPSRGLEDLQVQINQWAEDAQMRIVSVSVAYVPRAGWGAMVVGSPVVAEKGESDGN